MLPVNSAFVTSGFFGGVSAHQGFSEIAPRSTFANGPYASKETLGLRNVIAESRSNKLYSLLRVTCGVNFGQLGWEPDSLLDGIPETMYAGNIQSSQ